MPPAERGGGIHIATRGRTRQRLAADQGGGLIGPALRMVQPGKRCSGQRIEGFPTGFATVPGFATGVTPPLDAVRPAMGAAEIRDPVLPDLRQQRRDRDGGNRRAASPRRRGLRRLRREGRGDRTIWALARLIRLRQRQGKIDPPALRRAQNPNQSNPIREHHIVHG